MGEITRQPARAIQNALIDSVLAGLCALIVFGPIVGVVLKGYGFTLAPARVAILVAVVMAGRLALSLLLQSHRGKAFIARFEGADDGVYVRPPGYRSRLRWIIPLLVGLAIVFPFLATKYLLTVAILGLIYVLLGLGLNIVVGLAGLLDLGYVAFYAIGAYGLALGYQYLGLGFWAMLPLGAVMAALAGALLGFPVLRMHGDYLAIVTLGFGEIIRLVLNNWVSFTGGPNGVPVPSPTLFGLEFTRRAKDGGIPIHEFFHVSYNPNLKFIFLYAVLCLVVMLVLLLPWNAYQAGQSPFVTFFSKLGVPYIGSVMNIVVLTAALSSLNSGLYSTGRILRSMSMGGSAPKFMSKMSRHHVPYAGILATLGVYVVGVFLNYLVPSQVFEIVLNVASLGIIASWGFIVVCQMRLRKAIKEGKAAKVSFRMPGAPFTSWLTLLFLFSVLVLMAFDYPNGTYTIGSIPLLAVLLVAGWFGVRKRVHEIHSTAPTLRK